MLSVFVVASRICINPFFYVIALSSVLLAFSNGNVLVSCDQGFVYLMPFGSSVCCAICLVKITW